MEISKHRRVWILFVLVLLVLPVVGSRVRSSSEDLKSKVIHKKESPYNDYNLYASLDSKDSSSSSTPIYVNGNLYSGSYVGSPDLVNGLVDNSFNFYNLDSEYINLGGYGSFDNFWGYSNFTLGAAIKDQSRDKKTSISWTSETDFRGSNESRTTWVTEDGSLQLGAFEGFEDFTVDNNFSLDYDDYYSGEASLYHDSSTRDYLTKGLTDSREFEPEFLRVYLNNIVIDTPGIGFKGSLPRVFFDSDSNGRINVAGHSTGYGNAWEWEKVELHNIDYSSETIGEVFVEGSQVLTDISFNSSDSKTSSDQTITYIGEEGANLDSLRVSRSSGSSISKVKESSTGYFEAFKKFYAHADLGGSGDINATIELSDSLDFSSIKDSKTINLNDGTTTIDISDLSRAKYVRIKTEMATSDLVDFPKVHNYEITTDPGYSILDIGGAINLRVENSKPVLRIKDSSHEWHKIVGDQELSGDSYTNVVARYNQGNLDLYYGDSFISKNVGDIDIDVFPSTRDSYIGAYGGDRLVANAELDNIFITDKALSDPNFELVKEFGLYEYGETRNLEILSSPEIDLGAGSKTYYSEIQVNASNTDYTNYLPVPKDLELNGSDLTSFNNEIHSIDGFKWVKGSEITYNLPLDYEEYDEKAFSGASLVDNSDNNFVYTRDFSINNLLDQKIELIFSLEPEDLGFSSINYPDFSINEKDLIEENEGTTNPIIYNNFEVPPLTTTNYTLRGEFSVERNELIERVDYNVFTQIISYQSSKELLENTKNILESGELPKTKVINLESEASLNDIDVIVKTGISSEAEIKEIKCLTGTEPEINTRVVNEEYEAIIPPTGFKNGETSIKIFYQPAEKGFSFLGINLNFLDLEFSNFFNSINELLGLNLSLKVIK